jgi:hypothetical protein
MTPAKVSEFIDVSPPVDERLTTPVNAAALSLSCWVPLPVSGEMLSTIRNVWRLALRYLVDWVVVSPPPNRLRIDFTVLAIGEINQAFPMLLLPLFEDCFEDLV